MKSWINFFTILTVFTVGPILAAAPAVLPQALNTARYEAIWKKSPFTLSSAPSEEAGNTGFAESLALLGVTRLENAPFVTILNKTSQEKWIVDGHPEGNPLGLSLVSISTDRDPTAVVVTLRKGTETATVKFDPSVFTASIAPLPNVPMPTQQQVVPAQLQPAVNAPQPWKPPGTNVPQVRPMPRAQRRILAPNPNALPRQTSP